MDSILHQINRSLNQLRIRLNHYYLKQELQHLGIETIIEPSVRMENLDKIYVDDYCRIYHGATLIGESSAATGIFLGKNTKVREYAHLNAYTGYIFTGVNAFIGQGTVISGNGGVEIGDNTMIGNLCSITSANHIFKDDSLPLRFQGETRRGIKIGANVWISSQVAVLDGVTIGDDAIISAGAVVTTDVPPWTIAAGVPARIVRDRRGPKPT